jgi:hypothetical protein
MGQTWDLTTAEGWLAAYQSCYERYGWIWNPGGWLVRRLLKDVFKASSATLAAQRKTAFELIRAGKESGVDTMTITVDQHAGLDLGSAVEGIPIQVRLGAGGKMIIEVKYK